MYSFYTLFHVLNCVLSSDSFVFILACQLVVNASDVLNFSDVFVIY